MRASLNGTADNRGSTEQPSTEPLPGQVVAGKYRIESVLGEGGMGKVFAAEHVRTGKRVALKYVLASRGGGDGVAERFAREARAAGRIHHPNVIDIYDVAEDGAGTCLVMELLSGESLEELIDREGPLPIEDAVGILIDAARGIAAAHAEGVIHRDIKPPNIFLCAEASQGRVKVLDFGVSKLLCDEDAIPVTQTGAVVGTPHYMAPEQVRGVKDIDTRIDVYSLGAVLFEMLTGKPPFEAEKVTALLVKIATEPAPSLRSVRADAPEELSLILERALTKQRDDRYPDVASFARALEPFGGGTTFDQEGRSWTTRISTGNVRRSASGLSHASTVGADTLKSGARSRPVELPTTSRRPLLVAAVVAVLAVVGAAAWWATSDADVQSDADLEEGETSIRHAEEPIEDEASPDELPTGHEADALEPEPAAGAANTDSANADTPNTDTPNTDMPSTATENVETSTVASESETIDSVPDAEPAAATGSSRHGRSTRQIPREHSRRGSSSSTPRAGEISLDDF